MINILDRISAKSNSLSKSDRKIAQEVLQKPNLILNENLAQFSERIGVSQPTICRFCKKFGASGYPKFREILKLTLEKEDSVVISKVNADDNSETIARKVIEGTISELNNLLRNLDYTILTRSMDLISQARLVVLVASGLSQAAATDFKMRMLRLGINVQYLSDPSSMLFISSSVYQGDVIIALSATGQNKDVIACVNHAKKTNASVISICPKGSDLSNLCLLNLSCGYSNYSVNDDLMLCRMAQQSLLQILISGVMQRRSGSIYPIKESLKFAQEANYLKASSTTTRSEETDRIKESSVAQEHDLLSELEIANKEEDREKEDNTISVKWTL